MPLDGAMLSQVKQEIETAVGARVDRITQPGREELIVALRGRQGAYRLLISVNAASPRVHFTRAAVENPKTPPMFCMLMRKLLGSAQLIEVRQAGLDRILELDFDTIDELGDHVTLTLCVEIMGRHSNLIIRRPDGKIVDSIKRIDTSMSSVRPILPGLTYTLPPAPLEKLNQELKLSLNYGSVTFVTDPSLTSDKYATFQFDNFPHSPVLRTTGGDGRTTLTFEMPENWQVAEDAPEAMLTVTIPADALARLIISLETGDVRLAPMQLKTLTVALNNGGLRAEDLTVTRDLLVELPVGGCNIDHLSIAEYASIAATRCIRLHLDGDPADYTTDARTDNVVRIGNKEYDKRYTSTGPNGILNLYAKGLIYLNVDE